MFWKEDSPKIMFRARDDLVEVFPKPQRSAKFMPEWFKKLQKDLPNDGPTESGTVKRCVPVLEAITNGYIIPLWADLHVKITDVDGDLHIYMQFPDSFGFEEILGSHTWQQVGDSCPLSKFGLGKVLLKFTNPWVIETSPGYSVMFKSPPHQHSDIHIMEGVVDTDTYKRQVNFPFVWTGSETGEWVIPMGTPFIHVVPFKREKFKAEYGTWDHKEMTRIDRMHLTTFKDRYRKLWWHKRK